MIIRVKANCARAYGTGIKPSDPPLHWYVSQGPGQWSERLEVIKDTTFVIERQPNDMSAMASARFFRGRARLALALDGALGDFDEAVRLSGKEDSDPFTSRATATTSKPTWTEQR